VKLQINIYSKKYKAKKVPILQAAVFYENKKALNKRQSEIVKYFDTIYFET
tara:strand:+ start:35071 stop:35223 length:153 start_codon:yes stop_codon:yes gene_type:complete